MRAYIWTHYMMSGIQKGIQSLHIVGEMAGKYERVNPSRGPSYVCMREAFFNWAKNHRTVVLFDGGDSETLAEMYGKFLNAETQTIFEEKPTNIPYAVFKEDASMNMGTTAFGIVVPEWLIEQASLIRQELPKTKKLSPQEQWCADKIAFSSLARN